MVKALKCVSPEFVYDAHFREFCDTPEKTFGCETRKPRVFTNMNVALLFIQLIFQVIDKLSYLVSDPSVLI